MTRAWLLPLPRLRCASPSSSTTPRPRRHPAQSMAAGGALGALLARCGFPWYLSMLQDAQLGELAQLRTHAEAGTLLDALSDAGIEERHAAAIAAELAATPLQQLQQPQQPQQPQQQHPQQKQQQQQEEEDEDRGCNGGEAAAAAEAPPPFTFTAGGIYNPRFLSVGLNSMSIRISPIYFPFLLCRTPPSTGGLVRSCSWHGFAATRAPACRLSSAPPPPTTTCLGLHHPISFLGCTTQFPFQTASPARLRSAPLRQCGVRNPQTRAPTTSRTASGRSLTCRRRGCWR